MMNIEEFNRDGVTIERGLFIEPVADRLVQNMGFVRTELAACRLKREDRFVSGELPRYLSEFHFHPTLTDSVAWLLGTNDIALYFSRLLLKDSNWAGAVELHQDLPYFHGGHRKVSAFVPLAPMRAKDGGLCFVKGSHKFGMLERGSVNREAFPPLEDLCPDVEPGDVIFMNFLTWHYSGAGSSERPLMQITFQPATDGSFCDSPTLVSGDWQTEWFSQKGKCVRA